MQASVRISVLTAAIIALGAGGPERASAQDAQAELRSWQVPGWSFTPGVAIGWMFDDNVAVAGSNPFADSQSDTLLQVDPFGQLEFVSPRTTFSTGYRGSMRRYFELRDLDGVDHQIHATLRHRVTRRVSIFLNESFQQLPTTDALELNGLPFLRTGSRYNLISGGVEARLSRSLDLKSSYDVTTLDFLDDALPLTGGVIHAASAALTRRVNGRISAGGEYDIRIADLNEGRRQYFLHNTGGVFQYRAGERTTLDLSGGVTHLVDRLTDVKRTGAYMRAGLLHRFERATAGGEYDRSFAPSFMLGGTHRSHELRGYVDVPVYRNRLYLGASAAWRRTDPFTQEEPPLTSTWIRSTLGYAIQRWLRLEGYHAFNRQDNRLAGGRVTRQVAGVQVVVSEPMRIR